MPPASYKLRCAINSEKISVQIATGLLHQCGAGGFSVVPTNRRQTRCTLLNGSHLSYSKQETSWR